MLVFRGFKLCFVLECIVNNWSTFGLHVTQCSSSQLLFLLLTQSATLGIFNSRFIAGAEEN